MRVQCNKNGKRNPAAQKTQHKKPQQHGDLGQLETAHDETCFTRYSKVVRDCRRRVCRNWSRTALEISDVSRRQDVYTPDRHTANVNARQVKEVCTHSTKKIFCHKAKDGLILNLTVLYFVGVVDATDNDAHLSLPNHTSPTRFV